MDSKPSQQYFLVDTISNFFVKILNFLKKIPKVWGFPYLVRIYEKGGQEVTCVRKIAFMKEMSKNFTDQNS
jgi:hypothetical protein